MSTPSRHYKDELQDWLDQRLDADTCAEVERHLEGCPECRREYEAAAWTKQQTARHYVPAGLPPELQERILRSLRAEQPMVTVLPMPQRSQKRAMLPWMAAAAVAVLAAVLTAVYLGRPGSLPETFAADYRAVEARSLALELVTNDVKAMESFFATHGVSFNTRVFDLGMMKYQLVGGRVQAPSDRPRALFVYEGPNKQQVVCQMYLGKVGDLPSGAIVRQNNGISFQVYTVKGMTAVFWQEGAVVCALVSNGGAEEVIQLAFAKAMP